MKSLSFLEAATHTSEYLLHKYWARKPHNIVRQFLGELAPKNGVLIDPFCGSGVALLEGKRLGMRVFGTDINPVAHLISSVSCEPPDRDQFCDVVGQILEIGKSKFSEAFLLGNGKPAVRYCVHSVNTSCQYCGTISNVQTAVKSGSGYKCSECLKKLRFNLENLHSTSVTRVVYCDGIVSVAESDLITMQDLSQRELFGVSKDFDIHFSENRRILAFDGISTSRLFTKRNFSILGWFAEQFWNIADDRLRGAALMLLTASSAQCSRLIAHRNDMSTGGPAWTVPGFWVPAVHLETNPLIHLDARFRKLLKGLVALRKSHGMGKCILKNSSASDFLEGLAQEQVQADVVFLDPPYGDSVPYTEFSALWNSFLKSDATQAQLHDISVSDRLSAQDAWQRYADGLNDVFAKLIKVMKVNGKYILTFNNNDSRAWHSIVFAAQSVGLICSFIGYQIPAVVSAKAQFAPDNSYVGDFYLVLERRPEFEYSTDLSPVRDVLERAANLRGKKIRKALVKRLLFLTCMERNLAAQSLDLAESLIEEMFLDISKNHYKLKCGADEFSESLDTHLSNEVRSVLQGGSLSFADLFRYVSLRLKSVGGFEPHELRALAGLAFDFDGVHCRPLGKQGYANQQLLFS